MRDREKNKMHVGVIPDGNRRYMSKRHIKNLLSSYDTGIKKFYDFLEWCYDLSVREVTLYALSLENIRNRDDREIEILFKAFNKHAKKGLNNKTIHDKKVKVRVCGNRQDLIRYSPDSDLAREMVYNLDNLQSATSEYDNFTLNLAIAYGGRQEVLYAMKKMIEENAEVTEDNLRKNLWIKTDPDIIIRTSEDRLSNFLLWQSAYSEIYFIPKLWPELRKDDLENILGDYNLRERRYGR